MLKIETNSSMAGKNASAPRRLATAFGLLALTVGVASWKSPAGAQEFKLGVIEVTGEAIQRRPDDPATARPFEVRFIPGSMKGVAAFRPSATAKRSGMGGLTAWFREMYADGFADLAKQLQIDTSRPGFRKLAFEDIESVTVGMNTDKIQGVPGPSGSVKTPQPMHRLMFSGFTARAVAPFDWLNFLRQWKLDFKEVREGRGVYYKLALPVDPMGPWNFAVFLPDDRTIVVDDEKWIKEVASREVQEAPSFLRGADWDRASRGLVAFAIDNHDDRFSKDFDLGRADDKLVLSVFRGIERWTLGVADRDEIALVAEAPARDPKAAEAVSRAIEALAKLGLAALEIDLGPEEDLFPGPQADAYRICKGFLSGLKPRTDGSSVAVSVEGIGTIADVYSLIRLDFAKKIDGAKAEAEKSRAKAEEAKAASKLEKL